jgi:hypothetical protein
VLQSDLNAFLNQSQAQQNSVFDTNRELLLGNNDGFNFLKVFDTNRELLLGNNDGFNFLKEFRSLCGANWRCRTDWR